MGVAPLWLNLLSEIIENPIIQNIRNPLIQLQIKKMFDKADRDGDGKLTKEEWHRVLNGSGCNTSMWVVLMIYVTDWQWFYKLALWKYLRVFNFQSVQIQIRYIIECSELEYLTFSHHIHYRTYPLWIVNVHECE